MSSVSLPLTSFQGAFYVLDVCQLLNNGGPARLTPESQCSSPLLSSTFWDSNHEERKSLIVDTGSGSSWLVDGSTEASSTSSGLVWPWDNPAPSFFVQYALGSVEGRQGELQFHLWQEEKQETAVDPLPDQSASAAQNALSLRLAAGLVPPAGMELPSLSSRLVQGLLALGQPSLALETIVQPLQQQQGQGQPLQKSFVGSLVELQQRMAGAMLLQQEQQNQEGVEAAEEEASEGQATPSKDLSGYAFSLFLRPHMPLPPLAPPPPPPSSSSLTAGSAARAPVPAPQGSLSSLTVSAAAGAREWLMSLLNTALPLQDSQLLLKQQWDSLGRLQDSQLLLLPSASDHAHFLEPGAALHEMQLQGSKYWTVRLGSLELRQPAEERRREGASISRSTADDEDMSGAISGGEQVQGRGPALRLRASSSMETIQLGRGGRWEGGREGMRPTAEESAVQQPLAPVRQSEQAAPIAHRPDPPPLLSRKDLLASIDSGSSLIGLSEELYKQTMLQLQQHFHCKAPEGGSGSSGNGILDQRWACQCPTALHGGPSDAASIASIASHLGSLPRLVRQAAAAAGLASREPVTEAEPVLELWLPGRRVDSRGESAARDAGTDAAQEGLLTVFTASDYMMPFLPAAPAVDSSGQQSLLSSLLSNAAANLAALLAPPVCTPIFYAVPKERFAHPQPDVVLGIPFLNRHYAAFRPHCQDMEGAGGASAGSRASPCMGPGSILLGAARRGPLPPSPPTPHAAPAAAAAAAPESPVSAMERLSGTSAAASSAVAGEGGEGVRLTHRDSSRALSDAGRGLTPLGKQLHSICSNLARKVAQALQALRDLASDKE